MMSRVVGIDLGTTNSAIAVMMGSSRNYTQCRGEPPHFIGSRF